MEDYERLIVDAFGRARQAGWGVSDSLARLPASARVSDSLTLRLKECAELGLWKEGREIAAFLATAAEMPDVIREAVGRFHLRDTIAHAESLTRK